MRFALLGAVVSFACMAHTGHAQLYFPPNGSDTWETIDPAEFQWCDSTIAQLYDYLETNQSKAFILLNLVVLGVGCQDTYRDARGHSRK